MEDTRGRRLVTIEEATVAMFPDGPSSENGERGEALPKRGERRVVSRFTLDEEVSPRWLEVIL